MKLRVLWQKLVRRKLLGDTMTQDSSLNRCLTTTDLIGLGIGSTLGAGLYVVAGQVALDNAGPSVTISFLVAAVASALAGTASVARGWSAYFDSLVDKQISGFFNNTMHMEVDQMSEYPDLFAFGVTIVVTLLLAAGVQESARFNNIFTGVNLLVVLYVTVCGVFKMDAHNWNLSQEEVPQGAGAGGFMPFGFSGTMAGAATCFYAFVGFDVVATTGEETKNPQRSIPIGIVVSLLVIFLSYLSVSAVITLACPYYLLDRDAALPAVFDRAGWGIARYVITIGAVCGLSTSLLGAMFPLPRILYAMGNDGVIFRFMGRVSKRFKTPMIGTAVSGLLAGVMAMMFNLKELVDMMSIGTLLAYTLVSVSVLILRYEADVNLYGNQHTGKSQKFTSTNCAGEGKSRSVILRVIRPKSSQPTIHTSSTVKILVVVLCLLTAAFSSMLIFADDNLVGQERWAVAITTLLGLLLVGCIVLIILQPQSDASLPFKVPCVPVLPAISMFVNVYLMLKLSPMTWARFSVWMAAGALIYCTYGIRHSSEELKTKMAGLNLQERETLQPMVDGVDHAHSGSHAGVESGPASCKRDKTVESESKIGSDCCRA